MVPLAIFCVHCVLSRLFPGSSAQLMALRAALVTYFPLSLSFAWLVSGADLSTADAVWVAIFCSLVYTAIAYAYLHIFNMSETARRIRILYEIHRAGALTSAEIRSIYRSADIIHVRLKRLTDMQTLTYHGGHYSMNGTSLYCAARFLSAWRRLLRLDKRYGDRTA